MSNGNQRVLETTAARRKLPQVPTKAPNKMAMLTQFAERNFDIDENDDLLPSGPGPLSANTSHAQWKQRTGNSFVHPSVEMTPEQCTQLESSSHGLPLSGSLDMHHTSQKLAPLSLKRQQSISSDKNSSHSSSNEPCSIDPYISKRTQQFNTSLISTVDSRKRL